MKEMKEIKVGDTVVTRKYDSECCLLCDEKISRFDGEFGEVTSITRDGYYIVHGFIWPRSALEPSNPEVNIFEHTSRSIRIKLPEFKPEVGQEVSFFVKSREKWKTGIWYAELNGKHLIVEGGINPALVSEIKPILKPLRERIAIIIGRPDIHPIVDQIMAEISKQEGGPHDKI